MPEFIADLTVGFASWRSLSGKVSLNRSGGRLAFFRSSASASLRKIRSCKLHSRIPECLRFELIAAIETENSFNGHRFIRTPTLCVVLLGTVLGLGCSLPPIGITDPPDRRAKLVQPVQVTPLLIGLLGDKSISMGTARSTPIQESDLLEIIALLRTGGGVLALGFVGESTRLPLVCLRVEAPPQKPVQPTDKNPFIRAEKNNSYLDAMKRHESEYRHWDEEVSCRR